MGEELVSTFPSFNEESNPSEKSYHTSFAKYATERFPYFLSIGMSYEDYWNGDPELATFYLKAEKIRKSKRNTELWLQGMYIFDALCKVSPIFNPSAPSGTKAGEYPSRPYPITSEEVKKIKDKEHAEEVKNNADMFRMLVTAKNIKKRKEDEFNDN